MDGISLQLSREALDNLGKARAIQDAFFGSGNLQFRFSLTPHYLDPAAIRSLVEVDQIRLLSAHDPPRSVEVTWPGNEASVVQLSITGIDGKVRVDRHTGPWALFKFVRAGLPTGRGESFLLNMQMENIRAQYMLKSESAVNPMAIRELQGFQCAQSL
jgi:type VI protein secretion system component VasK